LDLKRGQGGRIKTGWHGEIHQRGRAGGKTEGLNNYGQNGRIKKEARRKNQHRESREEGSTQGGKAEGSIQGGRAEE
jgi:hypothetical protein